MQISIIAGARPNFMKIAPIIRAIERSNQAGSQINYQLIHTGQHYDQRMSGDFFKQLGIPQPTINLEAGGGSQAEQTAAIMIGFEKHLASNPADVVLVVGDVTSTLACAIVAKKMQTPVVHVEAGIRSGDRTMPEEINRIVTDSISDHFFTTTPEAGDNLLRDGVSDDKIHFVGNTMIDSLLRNLEYLEQPKVWRTHNLQPGKYLLTTLHRPSNVDDPAQLEKLLGAITKGAAGLPVVFPVHPRTQQMIKSIEYSADNLIQVNPMSYLEFIYLVKNSRAVITDSGGVSEETTVLNVPCMTLRDSTERPETVTLGSNELVGSRPELLSAYFSRLHRSEWKQATTPPLWDGQTSERIVSKLLEIYRQQPSKSNSELAYAYSN